MNKKQLSEEQIFHVAREIHGAGERAKYLDQACQRDSDLRQRVEALLGAQEDNGGFLQSNVAQNSTLQHSTNAKSSNERIGPYKLLHLLGEGGMGSVFLAEQQHPVKRRVAVKIIKQGLDAQQFFARFEAERQALAMMDHPSIAKVLDAGCADDGRNYFVMELVKGVPITEFCDENRLDTRERLELFVQVCKAVQHAHQKGIIHRDLKPSNVMVALYDDNPVPKVIDFGVAKAIHQPLTEQTLYTIPGQIVGTWEYMSPEQAILNQLDVDTRTDIYSLGVILYELLTGQTPLDLKSLKPEALEERLRRIREQQPLKPSNRISSLGEAAAATAAYRGTETSSLSKKLRGDLDTIVMKALEKDRSNRFETANGLAAEIQRFLNDEPLSIRPNSGWKQVPRFYRRNKAIVVTAALVFASLAIGLSVALWAVSNLKTAEKKLKKQQGQQQQTIRLFKNQIIKQGMERTLIGDLKGAEELIEYAREVKVSEDWLRTMEGSLELHRGDNPVARDKFNQALLKNPENVSAWALQSIALYHMGDNAGWIDHVADFEAKQPRQEFLELDELFLAYAMFYRNYEGAANKFDKLVGDRPAWMIPHLMRASAQAEGGQTSGNIEKILDSVARMRPYSEIGENNNLMSMLSLFICTVAKRYELEDQVDFDIDAHARKMIDRLEGFPKYSAGTLLRAYYHESSNQPLQADKAWREVFANADGAWACRAIAKVYAQQNDLDQVTSRDFKLLEAKIAQAIIQAIQHREQTEPSEEIEKELVSHQSSFFRLRWTYLLLVSKQKDRARQLCKEWCGGNWDHVRSYDERRVHCLELVEGKPRDKSKPNDGYLNLMLDFTEGLIAYADGDMKLAIDKMDRCRTSKNISMETDFAEVFYREWTATE